MTQWEILGIPPTTDKSVIKKAYRSRLADTNPEDKPEEFMALRQAYEEALQYASHPENSADSEQISDHTESPSALEQDLLPGDHPAHDWTRRLQELYLNFYRRIDAANWEELCSDPICTRIDTASDVQDALLRFLMEWWFVPDSVIRALDQTFHFEEQEDSLTQRYPKEFVDAILITPLHRQWGSLEYEFFEGAPDADYDDFINSYYTLTGMVNRREAEPAWELLSKMEASGVFHPYLQVEKAKLYLGGEKAELSAAAMEAVYPAYAASPVICCMTGETALALKDYEKALECFTKALEVSGESHWAKIGLAESNLELKKYEEAQKWVDQVLAEDRYSPRAQALEEAIQTGQKEGLLRKLADGESSDTDKLSLAAIYIDNGEFQLACDALADFQAEEKKLEAERLHYLATANLSLGHAEESREQFHHAAEILQGLLAVTPEEEEKKKQRMNLSRTRVMESVALEQLDQLEDALELVTNVTLDEPELNMPFCRKAELHYELKQYQEAIDAATRSLELDDSFHLPYRIRGNAYYELGYYNDAFQDCCDCIDIFPGEIEAYFCKINILIEVSEFDMAFQELDNLEAQVKGTQITFLRGKALEASGDLEKARLTYRQVMDDHADQQREIYQPAEVHSLAGTYYRLAQVCQELYRRQHRDVFWKEYMDLLQEGVKKFPANLDLMGDLASEFYGQSRHKEAQKLYEHLAELDPRAARFAQLAGNEIQMDQFDSALYHLKQAQELDRDLVYSEILFCAVHTCLEQYEEALTHINRAKQLADAQERNWPRILRDKAMVYARMKEYDQAIACYRENWQLYDHQEDMASVMEMYRLSGRYREALLEGESYMAGREPRECFRVLDEMKLAASSLEDWILVTRYCNMDTRKYNRHFYEGRFLMYSDVNDADTPKDALQSFLLAEEGNPSSINNLIEIAKLYLKLKNKKKAYEYAGKVLDAVPADFMDCGYQRSFYLARSAEALAILGKYKEAEERIQMAIEGRKCDFCQYCGCVDAYCAWVYLCCIRGDEEGAAKYREAGLAICAYDRDLLHYPDYFMTKKRGLFK